MGFSACPENSWVSVPAPRTRWFQCFMVSVFQCFSVCPENSVVSVFHGFSVSVPAPITRGFSVCPETSVACPETSVACPGNRGLNDKYHSPRIYSWVEFGARDTPNLIPRTSNLILHAISIRFVITTVPATLQISDFRFQISDFNWAIFRAAGTPFRIFSYLSWIKKQ